MKLNGRWAPREVGAVVGDEALDRQVDLADQHAIVELVDHAAQPGDHLVHLGLVGGVARQHALVRRPARRERRIGRVVAELGVLDQVPDHVDAEAVDAAVEPEAQHVVHRGADLGVAPVEVGLLGQERVIVVLAGRRHRAARRCRRTRTASCWAARRPAPGRARCTSRAAGSSRERRLSANQGCWSEVWFGTKSSRTFRPLRCAAATSASKSASEPNSGSMSRVVGDVVAEIGHRRGKDRRQPERVDAELRQIVEPRQDAREIADPVAVRVLKRARDRSDRGRRSATTAPDAPADRTTARATRARGDNLISRADVPGRRGSERRPASSRSPAIRVASSLAVRRRRSSAGRKRHAETVRPARLARASQRGPSSPRLLSPPSRVRARRRPRRSSTTRRSRKASWCSTAAGRPRSTRCRRARSSRDIPASRSRSMPASATSTTRRSTRSSRAASSTPTSRSCRRCRISSTGRRPACSPPSSRTAGTRSTRPSRIRTGTMSACSSPRSPMRTIRRW